MIAVWLRVRKGKGRKTNYALNWHVPVLDDNGDAVKYEGRPNTVRPSIC